MKDAFADLTRAVSSPSTSPFPTSLGQKPPRSRPLYSFDHPYTYWTPQAPTRHPDSYFSTDDLRKTADAYDILRACIQRLKREVLAVPIQITAKEDENDGDQAKGRIQEATRWFDQDGGVGGKGERRSHFENKVVEDLCVIGATAIYYEPARNGTPFQAIPIDAATIRPRVDAFGFPGADDIWYEQWIDGLYVVGFTKDQLCYDGIFPVTYTPYYKSPVEWLMTTVFTALKADEWDRMWLTEGDAPSQMLALPDDWKPQDIRDYVELWEATMSGNLRQRVKTKFVPAGTSSVMNPTRTEQQFQQFSHWLMQRTCAIMGVSPTAIGFEGSTYKVSQDSATQQTTDFGVGALLEFRKALYDDMLVRLGYPELECKNVTDQEEAASDRADRLLKSCGVAHLSVNEARSEDGKDPVEGGDVIFIPNTVVSLEHAQAQAEEATQQAQQQTEQGGHATDAAAEQPAQAKQQTALQNEVIKSAKKEAASPAKNEGQRADNLEADADLDRWERKALNRLKDGKPLDFAFQTEMPMHLQVYVRTFLEHCTDPDGIRDLFRSAKSVYSTSWERKHYGHHWRGRRLAAERAALDG